MYYNCSFTKLQLDDTAELAVTKRLRQFSSSSEAGRQQLSWQKRNQNSTGISREISRFYISGECRGIGNAGRGSIQTGQALRKRLQGLLCAGPADRAGYETLSSSILE